VKLSGRLLFVHTDFRYGCADMLRVAGLIEGLVREEQVLC
jgi:hypothetical protein